MKANNEYTFMSDLNDIINSGLNAKGKMESILMLARETMGALETTEALELGILDSEELKGYVALQDVDLHVAECNGCITNQDIVDFVKSSVDDFSEEQLIELEAVVRPND